MTLLGKLEKLTPRALAEARAQARAERRAAQLEAARLAREEAEIRALQAHVARKLNAPFLAAVASWTESGGRDDLPEHVRTQLDAIGESVQALMRAPGSAAITSGERAWADAVPGLVEQLLRCAEAARARAPQLTLEITEVIVASRPGSRAAWRQRALAAEGTGDLATAVQAHQSYLNITHGDRLGVVERVRRLQERDDQRARLAARLNAARKARVPLPDEAGPTLELLERPTPRRRLDDAVARLAAATSALPMAELARPETQDVLHHAIRWRREARLQPAPLDEDAARNLIVLRLNDLRQRLTGSRVCLVTPVRHRLLDTGLGERVDGYDVVVRFGAAGNVPGDGGSRTDFQVIRHDATDGWDTPAWLRMILADDPRDWVTGLRTHLVPGKQHAVAEKVLRRPVRHPVAELPRPAEAAAAPAPGEAPTDDVTDAYQLIRLLDVLAVCESVDLVGFHPEEDFGRTELSWLTPRLERLDEHAIGVR
ncbi:hypothetical protein LWF15_22840 [Kineosporia rhizophila]|uniref:hypothetical protein n=1 Tax=Kineosporia rhizophila TaxID=84633 RepID=UPI001E39D91D|nr:hypothetical protein [Kineosporia rhizophila]MCE0538340.1 hypothetical protein [Kineosporia rhizophila]